MPCGISPIKHPRYNIIPHYLGIFGITSSIKDIRVRLFNPDGHTLFLKVKL
jgi:hypothetical protein